MEIKRIIKDNYEQVGLCPQIWAEEMDQFLERHNLPKLTQEE